MSALAPPVESAKPPRPASPPLLPDEISAVARRKVLANRAGLSNGLRRNSGAAKGAGLRRRETFSKRLARRLASHARPVTVGVGVGVLLFLAIRFVAAGP